MRTINDSKKRSGKAAIKNILVLLMAVACVACSENSNLMSPAFETKTVRASGNPFTEILELNEFSSIDFRTAGQITLRQGAEQKVELTIDDNLREYIHLEVEKGCLMIEFSWYLEKG